MHDSSERSANLCTLVLNAYNLQRKRCDGFVCCHNLSMRYANMQCNVNHKREMFVLVWNKPSLVLPSERRLAHAQAGVLGHVRIWGELVSVRDGAAGCQNHSETGEGDFCFIGMIVCMVFDAYETYRHNMQHEGRHYCFGNTHACLGGELKSQS